MANAKKSENKQGALQIDEATKKRIEVMKTLYSQPVSMWEYPRILLGIPIERTISYATEVFHSFMDIAMTGVSRIKVPYSRTDVARNRMAMALLNSNFTHVLMLDSDHIHPKDIIHRLAYHVITRPEVKVVGGLNMKRAEPFEPCAYKKDPDDNLYRPLLSWTPGLAKVDVLGTGSILIERSVFETIRPPWFAQVYDEASVFGNNFPGEDSYFCLRCQEANIDIYCDTTLVSPHMTPTLVDDETFVEYMKQSTGQEQATIDGKQVNWGMNG